MIQEKKSSQHCPFSVQLTLLRSCRLIVTCKRYSESRGDSSLRAIFDLKIQALLDLCASAPLSRLILSNQICQRISDLGVGFVGSPMTHRKLIKMYLAMPTALRRKHQKNASFSASGDEQEDCIIVDCFLASEHRSRRGTGAV